MNMSSFSGAFAHVLLMFQHIVKADPDGSSGSRESAVAGERAILCEMERNRKFETLLLSNVEYTVLHGHTHIYYIGARSKNE